MLILYNEPPAVTAAGGPVSPLNALWLGAPRAPVPLPQFGHLLLVFPLGEAVVSFPDVTVDAAQYVLFAPRVRGELTMDGVTRSPSDPDEAAVLVLWLSPPFIADMARFLGISDSLGTLLSGLPLLRGDQMSAILLELAVTCRKAAAGTTESLFLEVVGEILQRMRLRQQALLALSHHKQSTVSDLLPHLLRARQFIEARYAQRLKVRDVADYVAISEFHFARLFKTAFDTTVRQFIIRLRLEKARHLLEQPGATVTQTAADVGYQSLSSFIHAFSGRFGLSPTQYQSQREKRRI